MCLTAAGTLCRARLSSLGGKGLRLITVAVVAAIALVASIKVRAQDDAFKPNASERNWVVTCLKKVGDTKPLDRCTGKVLAACMGWEGAPRSIKPSNQTAHIRACAQVETTIWDELLNNWYRDALTTLPEPVRDKLKAAQRAWVAYRDAKCEVELERKSSPMSLDRYRTCLMEETASRAIALRDLARDTD